MALDSALYPASQVTLVISDYTSITPLIVTITTLIGSVLIPLERPKDVTPVMSNSSGGKTHSGDAVNGQAAPPTGSFQFVEIDTADNVEVSAPVAWALAMSANSVAGTAFASHLFTPQLTLGGKLQAKGAFAIVNQAPTPVTHTITVPFRVDSVVEGEVDGARAITVSYTVVGAITRA